MSRPNFKKNKNIVVIGGGTGTFTVLSGLKKYPVSLSAIVSMADDGGSTGVLREEFGVLPPGSVRPALVALSSHPAKAMSELFNFRFSDGTLKGHNFGNLLITALAKMYGDFEKAIEETGKLLNVQGKVTPSTLDDASLCAELENGEVIRGETNIDIPKHDGNLRITKVWLDPPCRANPRAMEAILSANLIVIGPGDLFSSILPNLLVGGIVKAVQKSRAKKVYVCNLMTKFGETNNFSGKDFVAEIEKHLGDGALDAVIFNKKRPPRERVARYEKEGARFVEYKKEDFKNKKFRILDEDLLRKQGFIRHDSDRLAKALIKLA